MTGLLVMSLSAGAAWANPGNAQKEKVKKKVSSMQMYKAQYKAMVDGKISVKTNKFKDTANYWGASSVDKMSSLGLLAGYADGTFKPNKNVTQAEMVAILMRLVEVTEPKDDIDDEDEELKNVAPWVKNQVKLATDMGIINLNRFHSAEQASRLQTCVAFAKLLELKPDGLERRDLPFKDGLHISNNDLLYILAMYDKGLISGMPGGNFNPNHPITRGEMAAIIERILEMHDVDLDTIDDEEVAFSKLESDLYKLYGEIQDVDVYRIRLSGDKDEVDVMIEVDLGYRYNDDEWADLSDRNIKDWVEDLVEHIQNKLSEDTDVNGKIINIDDNNDVLVKFNKDGDDALEIDYEDDYYRDGSESVTDVAQEFSGKIYKVDGVRFAVDEVTYYTSDFIKVYMYQDDEDDVNWSKTRTTSDVKGICEGIVATFENDANADPELVKIYFYDEDSDLLRSYEYDLNELIEVI